MGAWLRAGGAAFALLLACPAWTSAQNRGPPVKFTIYAAGSLRQAFDDLLQAFGTPDGLGARAV